MNDLLISVTDLAEWINGAGVEPPPLVVDCRGESDYVKSHIPGAVNLPAGNLQDPLSERGALLPWPELAQRLAKAGIGRRGEVVLYDDSGLVPSARLFWVLECFGRGEVRLLNGGIIAWQSAGLQVEQESPSVPEAEPLTVPLTIPQALALKSDLEDALQDANTVIVDARSEAEYRGVLPTAKRNGHIPGAVHCNWEEHIKDLFDPTFRPIEELRDRYRGLGLSRDNQVIVYCRSGARSSHSYFTLRMLGYQRVKNYAGSWLEWGNDPDTLIETDL